MHSSKTAFQLQNTKAGQPIGPVCVSPALDGCAASALFGIGTPALSDTPECETCEWRTYNRVRVYAERRGVGRSGVHICRRERG